MIVLSYVSKNKRCCRQENFTKNSLLHNGTNTTTSKWLGFFKTFEKLLKDYFEKNVNIIHTNDLQVEKIFH